jgi:hypothetical protein
MQSPDSIQQIIRENDLPELPLADGEVLVEIHWQNRQDGGEDGACKHPGVWHIRNNITWYYLDKGECRWKPSVYGPSY